MTILQAQNGGLETCPDLVPAPDATPVAGSRSPAPFYATCGTPPTPRLGGPRARLLGLCLWWEVVSKA